MPAALVREIGRRLPNVFMRTVDPRPVPVAGARQVPYDQHPSIVQRRYRVAPSSPRLHGHVGNVDLQLYARKAGVVRYRVEVGKADADHGRVHPVADGCLVPNHRPGACREQEGRAHCQRSDSEPASERETRRSVAPLKHRLRPGGERRPLRSAPRDPPRDVHRNSEQQPREDLQRNEAAGTALFASELGLFPDVGLYLRETGVTFPRRKAQGVEPYPPADKSSGEGQL